MASRRFGLDEVVASRPFGYDEMRILVLLAMMKCWLPDLLAMMK